MKRALLAAVGVGGMLTAFAIAHPASAISLAKPQAAVQGIVTHTAPGQGRGAGGPGFGMGGGRVGPGFGMGAGRGGIGRVPGGPGRFSGRGPGTPRLYGGARGDHHGNHHHHGPRFRFYAPYYGGYPYSYAYNDFDNCRWLRRRAQATGGPYWWDRYYACIED